MTHKIVVAEFPFFGCSPSEITISTFEILRKGNPFIKSRS